MPEEAVYRHIGLYAYRRSALRRLSALPPAPLERIEALEQLRALWHGMTIQTGITQRPPPRGVDTPEDYRLVARLIETGHR
jgi:3-deoxy-manno-octulosonate cytidylyltransferase (CMP-KDO synthetase)